MNELEWLRAENARLRGLLDERPPMNEGLAENFAEWTGKVYRSDAAAAGRQHAEMH